MNQTKSDRFSESILIALIIFIPFSAYLVNLFGSDLISLGRDLLLGLLIIASLIKGFKKGWQLELLWPILFIVWGLASFFWRGESMSQWLRGVRYVLEPTALYLVICFLAISITSKSRILKAFILTTVIVSILGVFEYLFPTTFRYTLSSGIFRGELQDVHLVGGNIRRMQSTLAGPNALGLYLMVGISTVLAWWGLFRRGWSLLFLTLFAVCLGLTFSRSVLAGLVVALLAGLFLHRDAISEKTRLYLSRILILIIVLIGMAFILLPKSFSLHGSSNQIRLDQYSRIYSERSQIGLLGKGIGSAGLVSQYRFDNGPNNYSENTYLDIFEALGLVGVLLYLISWLVIIARLFRANSPQSGGIFMGAVGIFIAGIFITHFTGQAALWSLIILSALYSTKSGWLDKQLG